MPPPNEMNNVGRFFEAQFIDAFEALQAGNYDYANAMSRRWLLEPGMSDLHRAGFNLILGHGPDNYIDHAREAVAIYRRLLPEDMVARNGSDRALLHLWNYAAAAYESAQSRAQEDTVEEWSDELVQALLEADEGIWEGAAVAESAEAGFGQEANTEAVAAAGIVQEQSSNRDSTPTAADDVRRKKTGLLSPAESVSPPDKSSHGGSSSSDAGLAKTGLPSPDDSESTSDIPTGVDNNEAASEGSKTPVHPQPPVVQGEATPLPIHSRLQQPGQGLTSPTKLSSLGGQSIGPRSKPAPSKGTGSPPS